MGKTGFENLLRRVYASKRLTALLRAVNALVICLAVLTFLLLFCSFAAKSVVWLVRLLVVMGVPFLAVTLMRRAVNAKRPYEVFDIYDVQPRRSAGRSFPSRHAASVMIIATVALFSYVWVGAMLLLLGALMCLSRVLLGIHFPRDVIAGCSIGIISALIGIFVLLI